MTDTELSLILVGFMAFIVVAVIVLHMINFNNKYGEKQLSKDNNGKSPDISKSDSK